MSIHATTYERTAPLIASAAVAAVIGGAGLLGHVWASTTGTVTTDQTPALASVALHHFAHHPLAGQHRHVPPSSPHQAGQSRSSSLQAGGSRTRHVP